jgi:hypothetical protein
MASPRRQQQETTMSFKILLTATGLILSTATATYAQTVVPEYDGDANRVPGQVTIVPATPPVLADVFAGPNAIIEHGRNGAAWKRHFDERLSDVH